MYGAFEEWDSAIAAARRIYDPFSYRTVIEARLVPVVAAEALMLARRNPVLWQRDSAGDLDLVVLRGLARDTPVPGAATQTRTALPLLLQAYPLRFAGLQATGEVGFDAVAPMRERDAGSYVTDGQGRILPGTELKLGALEAWRAGAGLRAALTALVSRHDLLEPVGLPDGLAARFGLPDLFSVVARPDDRVFANGLAPQDWALAARLLAAQRISLYTMAALISQTPEAA